MVTSWEKVSRVDVGKADEGFVSPREWVVGCHGQRSSIMGTGWTFLWLRLMLVSPGRVK